MFQPSVVKFSELDRPVPGKDGDTFVWENQYFTRKDGTTFHNGPCNPVDHNAVSQRDSTCWVFEADDKVLLLTRIANV